jgi:hypothetical protein
VRAGLDGLSSEEIAEHQELADLLLQGDLVGNIARIRSITTRLDTARSAAAEEVAEQLRETVRTLRVSLRDRYAPVDESVFEEALRPLQELAPDNIVRGEDRRQLAANLELAGARADTAARHLDEILAQGQVSHLAISALVSRPITSEEELGLALTQIREAATAELANGKQVRFT